MYMYMNPWIAACAGFVPVVVVGHWLFFAAGKEKGGRRMDDGRGD